MKNCIRMHTVQFFARGRMLALRKPIQVPVVFCRHSAETDLDKWQAGSAEGSPALQQSGHFSGARVHPKSKLA